MRVLLLFFLLALVLARPAAAEVLHFHDGKTMEGKILAETAEEVTIRTNSGIEVAVSVDRIASIERTPAPEDVHAARWTALEEKPGATAEEYYQLGTWALEFFNEKAAKADWRRAVEIDPDHVLARQALKHKPYKGRWFETEAALEEFVAREKAEEEFQRLLLEKRAQGFDWFEGEWVPAEDMPKLEQGLRKYAGVWLEPEAYAPIKAMLAVAQLEQPTKIGNYLNVPYPQHQDGRFYVATTLGEETNLAWLRALNQGYEHAVELLGLAPDGCVWEGRARFYGFNSLENARLCYDKQLKSRDHSKWFSERMHEKPYGRMIKEIASLDYMRGDAERMTHVVAHNLGHFIAIYSHPKREPLAWFEEGFAAYLEDRQLGQLRTFCVTGDSTVETGKTVKREKKNVLQYAQELAVAGKGTPLKQLVLRSMSNLSTAEVYKSASVIAWLAHRDKAAFPAFYRELLTVEPLKQAPVFETHWGAGMDALEAQYQAWIKSLNFTPPPAED